MAKQCVLKEDFRNSCKELCTRNPKAPIAEEGFNCEFKNDMCDSYRLAKTLYEDDYEKTDELVSYTQLPSEQVPDITSRTGKWIRVDNHRWKCTACGKETDLPHYEGAYYCFNCGAKMKEEN